ncbi:hypothetical protein IFM89_010729, partial [Coptis chinensis]
YPNMFSNAQMPSTSSLFSAYASITAAIMLIRSIANELIPHQLQTQILSKIQFLFNPMSSRLTLLIEEFDGLTRNQVYEASELYLRAKINPSIERLQVSKSPRDKDLTVKIDKGEEIVDVFEGIQIKWRFICSETKKSNPHQPYASEQTSENRHFEITVHKKYRDIVLSSYIPYVLERAKTMKEENRVVKLHTLNGSYFDSFNDPGSWASINLEHPSTFDTLAMDQNLKKELIEDLERFVKRREFYRKVGKAWKRGYLLYGPPGTGKSSLIAAMANYLKFDVYDLELGNVYRNAQLRNVLVATANRSIVVIEDIDCTVDLQDREPRGEQQGPDIKLTLSGLLNFIDGLWSTCGDERIIVFTTNHKDRLDPALLRPGRMDMHIHMSYCTTDGFNLLALNYLGIHNNSCNKNKLYLEAEDLIENSKVTPAEVAEELMKSEDADVAIGHLLTFLKRKKMEPDEPIDDKPENQDPAKMQKVESEDVIYGGSGGGGGGGSGGDDIGLNSTVVVMVMHGGSGGGGGRSGGGGSSSSSGRNGECLNSTVAVVVIVLIVRGSSDGSNDGGGSGGGDDGGSNGGGGFNSLVVVVVIAGGG